MGKGSLVVVGTGIQIVGQLTVEAAAWIRLAEKVLYVVTDPLAESFIKDVNPHGAESLLGLYEEGKPRIATYNQMTERILACVRAGLLTCFVCYGHPGVFVYPSREAIRRARSEGYDAKMLPGVSSLDCLFADLNVDPSVSGCQCYDATDFLLHGRRIDPTSAVVLLQIGVVGEAAFRSTGPPLLALSLLRERLLQDYPVEHEVSVYEAAPFSWCEPSVRRLRLDALSESAVLRGSTLYIPPAYPPNADPVMQRRLSELRNM
jgi:uncharacterized protein YabN with tetrapyrrole methylase and pyrophosphatase domain